MTDTAITETDMTDKGAANAHLEKMFGLTGKRAIVTGAGSGLAEPMAKALARAGATVIAAHDDLAEARRVVDEIRADGGMADPAHCDVTDEGSIVALFAQGEAPDIVILGAMMQGGVPAVEMSAETWDSMFEINTRGAFLTAREAVRRMRASGRGGRIIGISTIGSQRPMLRGNAAYGSSKAALNQLCRNLAFEHVGDGILVNTVLPGAFLNNAPKVSGSENFQPSGPGLDLSRHLGGIGEPDDIGGIAVFLASHASRYITGQAFVVDGGFQVG